MSTTITLCLSATRESGVAPMGVIFTASATSPAKRVEDPFHDIEYVWSFDDPGNFTALSNSPIWGTDKNIAYGPETVHVFAAPGIYTVTCTAHDGVNLPKSANIEITVAVPKTVFSGTKTAVVSTAGNFSGKPAGAQEFTSIAAATLAMHGDQDYRILLRRGEIYTSQVNISETSGSGKRIAIGAFGNSGDDKPLIDMSGGSDGSGRTGVFTELYQGVVEEFSIRDIDYLGHADPISASQPVDADGDFLAFATVDDNSPLNTVHKTVWRCHAKNMGGMGIRTSGDERNLYVGDTFVDGWNNYGILLSEGGYVGFCGSSIKQPRGTINGSGKTETRWPDHGPCRCSRPTGPVIFSNCDLASFNEWGSASDSYAMQPVIRWEGGNGGYWGNGPDRTPSLVIDRVRGEGRAPQQPNQVNGTLRQNRKVMIDRLYMVYTNHQGVPTGHGGTTWRNCVFVVPNCRAGIGAGIQGAGIMTDQYPWGDGDTGTSLALTDETADRVDFYSNLIADMRSDLNAQNRSRSGGPRDFSFPTTTVNDSFFGNNIGYAPNRTTAQGFTAHNPLNTTQIFTPLYDGERFETETVDAEFATPPGDCASYRPLTGSSAIGGATTGKVSLLDFDGNLRSEVLAGLKRNMLSIGPYEPNLES